MSKVLKLKIPSRDNNPVKFKGIKYPQPKEGSNLPSNFFVCMAVGARQSGKTFSVVKLLKYYEDEGCYLDGNKVPIRTILISPTFESNPIFKTLRSLDIEEDVYDYYDDKLLLAILEEIEVEKQDILEYKEKKRIYNKFLRMPNASSFTPEELTMLQLMNYEAPEKPKYEEVPIINLILDDLVGTDSFKATGKSAINNLVIKNRHKGINIFILSQSSKQVPKIIRINTSLLLLYKYNSDSMLEDLYENVSAILSPEQFKALYTHAVEQPYNFLCVDTTKNPSEVKQNFNYLFVLKKGAPKQTQGKIDKLLDTK